jgi:hypothetical protein
MLLVIILGEVESRCVDYFCGDDAIARAGEAQLELTQALLRRRPLLGIKNVDP